MEMFKFKPIEELLLEPFTDNWLVQNYFEKSSLSMFFGDPGSCKSFLAMELAYCVGLGIDWYGNEVDQGNVLYIAGEGFNGIQKRMLALEEKYTYECENIYISSMPVNLIEIDSVFEILNASKCIGDPPKLIIIDTLHRNFGSGDENSSKDVGLLIKHLDKLKERTGACILLLHHSGHSSKSHSRGSSAFRGSLDSEYQLKKQKDKAQLISLKMKESDKPETINLQLCPTQVTLPNGESVKTAYLTKGTEIDTSSRLSLIFDVLKELIDESGQPLPSEVSKNKSEFKNEYCVPLGEWKKIAYRRLSQTLSNSSSIQATFSRYKNNLLNSKKIAQVDGYVVLL